MPSLRSPHDFAKGDTVHDTRNDRPGVITHRPEPGTWICLGHPDEPHNMERRWHTLYGDLEPISPAEEAQ